MAEDNKESALKNYFNQAKSELKEKYERDGALGFLDLEDDVERLLPGATEWERNNSRLNYDITGEARPLSHKLKEGTAWTITNGIPVASGIIKGVKTIGKGAKGLKAIANVADDIAKAGGKKGEGIIDAAIHSAPKVAKEAVDDVAKRLAEEAPKKEAKTMLGRLFQRANRTKPTEIELRAAKNTLNNVEVAVKALSSFAPGLPKDLINRYGTEKGIKMFIALAAAIKSGKLASNFRNFSGESTLDIENNPEVKFDPRTEISLPRAAWQFAKSVVDADDLNPKLYNMDDVNLRVNTLNAETGKWDKEQVKRWGDDEKIKLLKDTAKGRYDEDYDSEDLSSQLYNLHKDFTNRDEEK